MVTSFREDFQGFWFYTATIQTMALMENHRQIAPTKYHRYNDYRSMRWYISAQIAVTARR